MGHHSKTLAVPQGMEVVNAYKNPFLFTLNDMERINNILSIQNLSSVNHPNQLQQNLQMQSLMQLHHLQQQQQHQQLQQQLQHHHQQLQQQAQQQQHAQQQQLNPHLQQQLQQQIQHHQTNGHHPRTQNRNNHRNNHNSTTANSRSNHTSPKKELIDLITCKLCKGFLVDATTLDLCMHSFCRPCAIIYITERHKCPECEIEIKDKRYLNRLKPDLTLQSIVYKLVPGLYEREMERRRDFYASKDSQVPRYKSEMFGDIPPYKTIKPDDMLNIGITWNRQSTDEPIKTYIHCRSDSNMLMIKKLIVAKFGLEKPIKVYYGNSEIFFDLTTLMDVAATFSWAPENKILNLSFKEDDDVKLEKDLVNFLPQMSSGPDLLNGP